MRCYAPAARPGPGPPGASSGVGDLDDVQRLVMMP